VELRFWVGRALWWNCPVAIRELAWRRVFTSARAEKENGEGKGAEKSGKAFYASRRIVKFAIIQQVVSWARGGKGT
jgi:hypothetical protein